MKGPPPAFTSWSGSTALDVPASSNGTGPPGARTIKRLNSLVDIQHRPEILPVRMRSPAVPGRRNASAGGALLHWMRNGAAADLALNMTCGLQSGTLMLSVPRGLLWQPQPARTSVADCTASAAIRRLPHHSLFTPRCFRHAMPGAVLTDRLLRDLLVAVTSSIRFCTSYAACHPARHNSRLASRRHVGCLYSLVDDTSVPVYHGVAI